MNTIEKGNILERVVEDLCSGIKNSHVKRNVKIRGKKSGSEREVDVLIEGKYGVFNVRVALESKNYSIPVGVEKIESLKAKLEDIGADIGVMICPNALLLR